MSHTLVIVESPAKCKKIEQYLGPGYKCMASFGHIRTLHGLESIDVSKNFHPTYTALDSKKQQIAKLREAIKSAKNVLLAADDDREGEAIAWHICKTFSLPVNTTKRIIFHEVTQTALQRAVKNATIINMNTVWAQQARQVLDLLVGYTISPILWSNITKKTKSSLSAGRCQTPALRLVYDNQKDIDGAPGDKVYQTTGYFTNKNLPFQLTTQYSTETEMSDFLEETVNHTHLYNCGKQRKVTRQPPDPFTTSTLQQKASGELRFSPKQTMMVCQALYEAGYITYMRTDSKTYSTEFVDAVKKYATIHPKYTKYIHPEVERLTTRGETSKQSKKAETDSNAQEAHEAIRPTDITKTEAKDMDSQQQRMYAMIWRNTLESCMAPSQHQGVTAMITAPTPKITPKTTQKTTLLKHEYRYSTERIVFPGWKIVGGYEEDDSLFTYLQTIKANTVLPYKKMTSQVSMKNLKSHYTEARLVQLLEKQGIGRPSTFSSLIDKIQERNYVKKTNIEGKTIACIDFELENDELSQIETEREFGGEHSKLVIQPIGVLVIEFLMKHFDKLFDYDYTKKMEDTLDMIAKGNKVWHTLCAECYEDMNSQAAALTTKDKAVIKIDDKHTYMVGKFGPVIRCSATATETATSTTKKQKQKQKDTFLSVREDIDIEKLRRGEYTLDDIVVQDTRYKRVLGTYKNTDVILQEGKYGLYVSWNKVNKSVSLQELDKTREEVTLEDVVSETKNIFEAMKPSVPERNLGIYQSPTQKVAKKDAAVIVRDGKFGLYARWNKRNVSVSKLNKDIDEIKLSDVIQFLDGVPQGKSYKSRYKK